MFESCWLWPGEDRSEHVEDETFIIVGCVLGVEASVDEPAEGFGGEFQFGGRLQRVVGVNVTESGVTSTVKPRGGSVVATVMVVVSPLGLAV